MLSVNKEKELLEKLRKERRLSLPDYEKLVGTKDEEVIALAAKYADEERKKVFGTDVYIRGLIEVGNVCRNDCFYCGIRRSNKNCERYVLSEKQILSCCEEGYSLGFRTFVLQGGEGVMQTEKICSVVEKIKRSFPNCAVTLSLGEYPFEDYKRMKESGADRYLLRHETADGEHYRKLHPKELKPENRMRCLRDLKKLGFQVGCGFMVGSPFQTDSCIAKDLKFIEEFRPEMCGIGPFLPQRDTPFGSYEAGSAEKTIFLLSLVRLINPEILLPATTALGTALEGGREKGLKAGANVVMPNLSPLEERKKYALYDNKLSSGAESAQSLELLKKSVKNAGYNIVYTRGDAIAFSK